MAEHVEIPSPHVEALKSDPYAVHVQLEEVAEKLGQDAARRFAEKAATAVGAAHCPPAHTDPPARLPSVSTVTAARENAARHTGLCGRHQAAVIANVRTGDILANGRQPTGTAFRNQACYDAAQSINCKGRGVQVRREDCFTEACRALWPGAEIMSKTIQDAFK